MKIQNLLSILGLLVFSFSFGQETKPPFYKMTEEQQKEALANLKNTDDRRAFFRQYQEDELVRKLNLNEETEKKFRPLFVAYMKSQREIKNQFNRKEDFDKLSDQEAKAELENSFAVGQKLLDNRKKYTQEFQKILSAKQILQLYFSEMKFRGQIEEGKIPHQLKDKNIKNHSN